MHGRSPMLIFGGLCECSRFLRVSVYHGSECEFLNGFVNVVFGSGYHRVAGERV